MDRWIFSFVITCFSALLWPSLPPLLLLWFTLIATIIASLRRQVVLSGLLCGCCWISLVGYWQLYWKLPPKTIQQADVIEGRVDSLVKPDFDGQSLIFTFTISRINGKDLFFSPKVRLNWYQHALNFSQGNKLRLKVKLKLPRGLGNEGGFDYQKWLFSQGIVATGYVKSDNDNTIIDSKSSVRQQLADRFWQLPLQNTAWLAALSFGYRGELQPADWRLMQRTGTAHLFAISGLHLGLVAAFSYPLIAPFSAFLLMVKRRSSLLASFHINLRHLTLLLTLFPTGAYVALAGFALPTVRAWLMLAVACCLICCYRLWQWRLFFGLCLLLVCLLLPLSMFSIGFWLSFSAVAAIAFIYWRWPIAPQNPIARYLILLVRLQLALSLLMLPLIAWQFSLLSAVAPVINLLAIPLVSFVLLPLSLLGTLALLFNLSIAEKMLGVADQLMDWSLRALTKFSDLSWATIALPDVPLWSWMLAGLYFLMLLMPRLPVAKHWLFILLLPLCSYQFFPHRQGWQVDILDVGQGLSVMVTRNKKVLLYDVGVRFPSGFNMADGVILPLLKARGITVINKLFISHGDNDHAGSLPMLRAGINIDQMYTGDRCRRGLQWQWQGLTIKAVWPDEGEYSSNDSSCVLHISDGQRALLLSGDISKKVESRLVLLEQSRLRADVLVAPHHGSNTSSSRAFIDAVQPEWVLFSQGHNNRWGFPKPEVLARYQQQNSNMLSTSTAGQISVSFVPDKEIELTTFRQHYTGIWVND